MSDSPYTKILDLIDSGNPMAAVVVLSAHGSTPQVAGARAIVEASGRLWGTVGGGMVEARALRTAAEVCQTGIPRVFDCDMTADASREAAICGGQMRVLVDPTVARHRAAFEQAARALVERRRGCLVTRLHTAAAENTEAVNAEEVIVEVEWLAEPSLPAEGPFPGRDEIRSCLESGAARRYAAEPAGEVFIEPVVPSPLLLICGGGHVGRAVACAAHIAGFEVTLIDDRPQYADASLFPPGVRVVCGPVAREIAACPLDDESSIVLVTRGHRHDAEALVHCIRRPHAYLGMIGSRRKVALVRKRFLDEGLATAEEFDRVRAPIGLPIGAVTVPEIAVSIVAQLIAVRRKAPLA